MSVQIQDVEAPARATARSLWATYGRMGGSNEREKNARFESLLESQVQKRTIDLGGVALEEIAELSLGSRWRAVLIESRHRRHQQVALLEDLGGQAVTSDFFAAVTGQRVYSEIRQASELPEFVFTKRLRRVKSDIIGTETVPDIAGLGDVSAEALEAEGVHFVGMGAHTVTLPESAKRHLGVQITEETLKTTNAVGLTASVVRQASRVGLFLGYRGELKRIDVVIGYVNPYIRDGVGTNTYLTSGAYINNQTSAALVDWTDIDSAEQLLSEILDPDTGLPMLDPAGARDLVVSPGLAATAYRIVSAMEVRHGDITSGAGIQTVSGNPLRRTPNVIESKIMYQRILATLESEAAKAKAGWFYGSLDAFAWKEFLPLTVMQQGPNSDASFTHDVIARWKAKEHGVAYVDNPRLITRNEDSAWA